MSNYVSSSVENEYRPLERIFPSSYARLLDFLLLNQLFYYSHAELSKLANIPTRTLQRVLPLLLEEKLVIKLKKKQSKGYMYKFNHQSERAKALEYYFTATIKEDLELIEDSRKARYDVDHLKGQNTGNSSGKHGVMRNITLS